MTSMLVCVSHSPIIMIRARPPAEEQQILELYARCREEILKFDPELVVIFGADHFAGFHLSLMPPYCVGLAAMAVDDVGGFPGSLAVPQQTALTLVEGLHDANFDVAVSWRMQVDHAFSQPLHRLLGSLDRYPVIPVFINAMVPPLLRFGRSRGLGAAAGKVLKTDGKRVLMIGSGGLSHHPMRYYPAPENATPEVLEWQIEGERGQAMTAVTWFQRLYDMHVEGASMLVDGRRTREDIRLNPAFDQRFMAMANELDTSAADHWDPQSTVREAGIGSMELHGWVAAVAAYKTLDGRLPHDSIYVPALEYGIGYGMLVAGGGN